MAYLSRALPDTRIIILVLMQTSRTGSELILVSCDNHTLCPAACRQFRDMLRKHITEQNNVPKHSGGAQTDDRLPLDSIFLSPATSSEEPERSAASAPGPGNAGQDGAPRPPWGKSLPQMDNPAPKRQVSIRRPPTHRLAGSLPASRSGSVHMQVISTSYSLSRCPPPVILAPASYTPCSCPDKVPEFYTCSTFW